MAGYDHHRGMSNNAVDAYRRNLKPISRFTAQDLRRRQHRNLARPLPGGWPRTQLLETRPTGITRRSYYNQGQLL